MQETNIDRKADWEIQNKTLGPSNMRKLRKEGKPRGDWDGMSSEVEGEFGVLKAKRIKYFKKEEVNWNAAHKLSMVRIVE